MWHRLLSVKLASIMLACWIMEAAILSTCCLAQTATATQRNGEDAAGPLATLVAELQAGRVDSVDVFYIPLDVLTDERVTPEALRHDYFYKIHMQRFRASREAALLLKALKKTTVRTVPGPSDLRVGAVFTLDDGRVLEIYMDGSGHFGQIAGSKTSFHGELSSWFRHLTGCLR